MQTLAGTKQPIHLFDTPHGYRATVYYVELEDMRGITLTVKKGWTYNLHREGEQFAHKSGKWTELARSSAEAIQEANAVTMQ